MCSWIPARCWFFAWVLLVSIVSAAEADQKPNILFVFADDMAFDTVHALGNHEIATPNIDRLVERGVTFTHAYNPGAWHGAVCVASRTMLNTGRFLWYARQEEKLLRKKHAKEGKFWSQMLSGAGYDTYFTGKWHVKTPPQEVFRVVKNVRGGMPNQTKQGYNRPHEGKPDPWKPWDKSFGGFWKGGKHWSEVVADDAIEFLGQAEKREQPFFMYIAFNAPHDPRQSPKEYVDKYPLDKIALPQPYYPDYPYQIGSNRIRDEKLAPFPRTKYAVKVNRQEYYAIITHMDAQIGRILERLEESPKRQKTYVFFTADHGLAVGHHGLMGKQNMFDHSVRVPFIMTGPDVPRNEKLGARIYLQDVMPTTLELAGIPVPERVQFRSVLPLVRGKRQQSYDSIYGAYTATQRMVTAGDYKLIVYPKIGRKLLYNIKVDPLEMKDLAEQSENAARIKELMVKLRELQKFAGDDLELVAK